MYKYLCRKCGDRINYLKKEETLLKNDLKKYSPAKIWNRTVIYAQDVLLKEHWMWKAETHKLQSAVKKVEKINIKIVKVRKYTWNLIKPVKIEKRANNELPRALVILPLKKMALVIRELINKNT